MKKQIVLAFSLFVTFVLLGGMFWRRAGIFARDSSNVSSASKGSDKMVEDFVDERAREARAGDEASVRRLADEIFNTAYFIGLPDDVKEPMKERVVLDELRYRRGKKGIVEEKVVLTVNELARKLDAPEYAKTSHAQVRALRVRLMRGYPNFIAQETRAERKGLMKQVGDTINPEMSPLEATFVTGVLVQQKLLNEDFQYSPQEWEDKLRNKKLKKWEAGGQSLGGAAKQRLVVTKNEKRDEIRQALTRGLSRMTASELHNLPDATLDTLGIAR